ncbi:MAG TPA: hypothetical protein VGF55_26235 [Gemmataceae bacterium]
MASSDRATRRAALAALGVGAVAGVVLAVLGLRSPPQMGADPDVFRTVDALFTAVTGRDERRLGECEHRLRGLRDAGALPPAAADYLDGVIRQARAGDWRPAAERLYKFMIAQRRDPGGDRPPPAAPKRRPGPS